MAEGAEFGPRKTIIVLAIVAGCFALLWPKIFYSMPGTPVSTLHTSVGPGPPRQERRTPPHAASLHPALRERGRSIPSSRGLPKVDGRQDNIGVQKIRPPLGAAGRVVATTAENNNMGIFMPLYTLGIILFFVYTIAKVMRKNEDNTIYAEYDNPAAEREFRDKVFSPEVLNGGLCGETERRASPKRVAPTIGQLREQAAGDIEIDQLRQRLVDTEAAMERIVVRMSSVSRTDVNGSPRATHIHQNPLVQGAISDVQ